MTGTAVRDALQAHLRNEARREARMAHMRQVAWWFFLAAMGAIIAQTATGETWLQYVFAVSLSLAVILPRSLTWDAVRRWRPHGRIVRSDGRKFWTWGAYHRALDEKDAE